MRCRAEQGGVLLGRLRGCPAGLARAKAPRTEALTKRQLCLVYPRSHRCTLLQAIDLAAELGLDAVGLRLWPNAQGVPNQTA